MKNILVPLDFSADSINALEHAIRLANTTESNVVMLHVVHYKNFETPFYFSDLEDFKGKTVNDYINLILYRYQPQVNQNLTYQIVEGNVSREIVKYAEDNKIDYIIMGTHGASGSDSYWIGSNAYKVVSNATCPVVTIRNGFMRDRINKIVLPIDASKNTRRKLPFTADMAAFFDAEIHVIGVTETAMSDILKRVESWVKQTDEYLEQRQIKHVTMMLQGSNITEMTIDYAKSIDADLIAIMTEQGEHPVSLLMGAYAQHMVNNSPIPVLTLRPTLAYQ
ncbi:MAG: universal stress protein [Bacteroidales bacterium]|nr:universal stress protein [Bacteroidales bacterium]